MKPGCVPVWEVTQVMSLGEKLKMQNSYESMFLSV